MWLGVFRTTRAQVVGPGVEKWVVSVGRVMGGIARLSGIRSLFAGLGDKT